MELVTRRFSREPARNRNLTLPLPRPRAIDIRRSILKRLIMGAFCLSAFGLAGQLRAAVLSPDADTSALFTVIAKTEAAGSDPRIDPEFAVQSSYFGFREMIHVRPQEAPFAPRMPRLERPAQVAVPGEATYSMSPSR